MLLLGTGRQAVDEAVRLGAFAKYPAVFASTTNALVDCVPLSIPITSSLICCVS